jgi:hypothetical protein
MPAEPLIDFDTAYFSWIPGSKTYEIHYENPADYQWRPRQITSNDLEEALVAQARGRSQEVLTTPVRTKVGVWFPPLGIVKHAR